MDILDPDMPSENEQDFLKLRAIAIDMYAGLERGLCDVMAYTLQMPRPAADIIFYRITNTRSRNVIISDAVKWRFENAYQHFWHGIPGTPHKKGLMNLIEVLDKERNKIVHWHTVDEVDHKNETITTKLFKPILWEQDEESPRVTQSDLEEFIKNAEFAAEMAFQFAIFIDDFYDRGPEDEQTAWRDIFQQPCTYPPLDTHPIFQTGKIQYTQPLSSQE